MKRRLLVSCIAVGLFAGFIDPPAASAQQSVNFFVGAFIPDGLHSRDTNDVLYQNTGFLDFHFKDFDGITAGGEYLVQLGDFFDAGFGVGFYSQSTLAADSDFQHPNGALILSDLKLRIIPITATFRWLPIGHHDAFVPYVGAGVGIYRWRYEETGEFLDLQNNIFSGTFRAEDTTVGPVILGGVRIPVGRKGSGFGGEIRWQDGKGDLPPGQGFAGTKIDLGGFNYLFTVNVGF